MNTVFSRWLPATAETSAVRRVALGVAGLACAGGIVGGTAAVASAMPLADGDRSAAEKVTNYQYERQPNFFYCGPAATRIAATAHGHTLSQDDVARQLGTTVDGTPSAEDTTRVLNSLDGKADYKTVSIPDTAADDAETDRLRSDVVRALEDDNPVVANVIGTAVDTDGGVHSYEGGHYLTVVGYRDDGQTVKIADPAETVGDGSYWMTTSGLADWIATRGYSA